MQDLAHAEMVSPSSSASEMEPVKDPNQCWLNPTKCFFLMPFSLFWLWGCFAYASWDCFETICRQGALAVKQSSQVETCHMSGLKFGTDHGLSQQIQAYPFFWPALMWKENKKHVMDPACRWMLKWSNNLSRCWPTRSTKAIEISSRFFDPFLSTWMSWSELGSTAPATKLKEARVRWNGCATPLRSRGGKHGPLCTSFFLQEEMPAMPAVDAEKAGDVFTNTYISWYFHYSWDLFSIKKMERYVQWHLCTAKLRRTLLWVFVEQNLFSHAHSYRSSAHCYLWAWSWIKAWQIRWNRWLSTCQWMETWWCNRIRRMDRFFLLVANQSHEFP